MAVDPHKSQPSGSIDGTLRVTEQGEMVQARFGMVGIALRTLEVYTTATLEKALVQNDAAGPEWRNAGNIGQQRSERADSVASFGCGLSVRELPDATPYA